jgi:hypothetical protein
MFARGKLKEKDEPVVHLLRGESSPIWPGTDPLGHFLAQIFIRVVDRKVVEIVVAIAEILESERCYDAV